MRKSTLWMIIFTFILAWANIETFIFNDRLIGAVCYVGAFISLLGYTIHHKMEEPQPARSKPVRRQAGVVGGWELEAHFDLNLVVEEAFNYF